MPVKIQKSADVRPPISILVFGPPNSGKTSFAMSWAGISGRPEADLLVVDLEGSTLMYSGKSGINFDVIHGITTMDELLEAVNYARSNSRRYATFVIDGLTGFFNRLKEARMLQQRKQEMNVAIHGWANQQMERLFFQLRQFPINVIVTAWETTIYAVPDSKTGVIEATGTKPGLNPAAAHSFNFILQLVYDPIQGDKSRMVRVVKQRGTRKWFPETMPRISYQDFKAVLDTFAEGEIPEVAANVDEVIAKQAEDIERAEKAQAQSAQDTFIARLIPPYPSVDAVREMARELKLRYSPEQENELYIKLREAYWYNSLRHKLGHEGLERFIREYQPQYHPDDEETLNKIVEGMMKNG